MVVDRLEEEMELRPGLVVTALEALSNMPLTDPQQVRQPPASTKREHPGEPHSVGGVKPLTILQHLQQASD